MDWKPMNFGSIPSIVLFKYDVVQVVAAASYERLREKYCPHLQL
jgi:hypothetical protein